MAREHRLCQRRLAATLTWAVLTGLAAAQTAPTDVQSASGLRTAIDNGVEYIRLTSHLKLSPVATAGDKLLGGPIRTRLAIWGYCTTAPGPEYALQEPWTPGQCVIDAQDLGRPFVLQGSAARLWLSDLVLLRSTSAGELSRIGDVSDVDNEGGTILALPGTRLYLRDLSITGSSSDLNDGGAVSLRSAQGNITSVVFLENSSRLNGGALAIKQLSTTDGGSAADSVVYIETSRFDRNSPRISENIWMGQGSKVTLVDARLQYNPPPPGVVGTRGVSWDAVVQSEVSLLTDYSELLALPNAPIKPLPVDQSFRSLAADDPDAAFLANIDMERKNPRPVTLEAPETPVAAPSSDKSRGVPVGAIVGGIAGALILIAAALGAWWCWRKRQQHMPTDTKPSKVPVAAEERSDNSAHEAMLQMEADDTADAKVVVVTRAYTSSVGPASRHSDIHSEHLSITSDHTFGSLPLTHTGGAAGATVLGLNLLCTRRQHGDESVHEMPDLAARKTAVALDHIRLVLGGTFDGYKLDRNETQEAGGQALVVLATSEHGLQVAIKMFDDARAFEREVEVYKVLSSWGGKQDLFLLDARDGTAEPRVLRPGLPMPSYIVMRRGESMQRWIVRRAPEPMRALWMLGEVCSQLQVMHDAGYVHRDIKPANILWLQDYTQWRLIDFGSASRCNELSEPSFTLRFAAPEAIREVYAASRSHRADAAAGVVTSAPMMTTAHASEDVWAMGVIAFELFSGRPFYDDKSDTTMIKAMLLGDEAFPHESQPEVFAAMGRCGPVVRHMLNRDPEQRLTVAAVLKQLQNVLR